MHVEIMWVYVDKYVCCTCCMYTGVGVHRHVCMYIAMYVYNTYIYVYIRCTQGNFQKKKKLQCNISM